MKQMIDGVEVDVSPDEEAALRAEWAEFEASRLSRHAAIALAEIDARHAAASSKHLTPGVDYSRKLREAEYVADADDIDPSLCPMLAAGIGISIQSSGNIKEDLKAMAAIVRQKDAETASALAPLDHVRQAAKAAIRAATTADEINIVLASTTFRDL